MTPSCGRCSHDAYKLRHALPTGFDLNCLNSAQSLFYAGNYGRAHRVITAQAPKFGSLVDPGPRWPCGSTEMTMGVAGSASLADRCPTRKAARLSSTRTSGDRSWTCTTTDHTCTPWILSSPIPSATSTPTGCKPGSPSFPELQRPAESRNCASRAGRPGTELADAGVLIRTAITAGNQRSTSKCWDGACRRSERQSFLLASPWRSELLRHPRTRRGD